MDSLNSVKSVQEQAMASWVTYLNQIRIDILLEKLLQQDINLENALAELDGLKKSIAEEVIKRNRGGEKGMHGFIGERMQVSLENAKRLIDGLNREYILIDDNGSIDYYRNEIPIQQKARQANLGIGSIKEHLEKYPDFLKINGKYQIPKDYYAKLETLWSLPADKAGKLERSDYNFWKYIQKFKEDTGISFDKIEPMDVNYSEIQKGTYQKTIKVKEKELKKRDHANRSEAYKKSKPSFQEAKKVTIISTGIEAATAMCIAIAKKHKEGKKISDYTEDDWRDVGLDTGKGAIKGGIRGATVYAMSNFTCTSANVASALVTATFGTVSNAIKLSNGEISQEEFIINSETCCLDAGISAVSAVLGEILIPIPVLGALIGCSIGNYMYGIVQTYCDENTKKCVAQYYNEIQSLNEQLDSKYKCFVERLEREFKKYSTILEFAFDENINIAFNNSIILAQLSGVAEDKILKTKTDIDNYFLN